MKTKLFLCCFLGFHQVLLCVSGKQEEKSVVQVHKNKQVGKKQRNNTADSDKDKDKKSIDISFDHEEVFGVRGSQTFEDFPTVHDEVKFSKLQWQDENGEKGTFNFKNPKWAEEAEQNKTFHGEYFLDDAQDFVNEHHNDDWYDSSLPFADRIPWFKDRFQVKNVNPMSNEDYYNYLMQEYQRGDSDFEEPIYADYGNTRLKKSAEKPKTARDDGVSAREPCTYKSFRLCNIFFAIPVITLIVIGLVGLYFFGLYCYLKNPRKVCTRFCPCLYRYGNKLIITDWADTVKATRLSDLDDPSVERDRLVTV